VSAVDIDAAKPNNRAMAGLRMPAIPFNSETLP